MKVLIAIDSFKGSVSSIEAGEAAKCGVLKVYDNAEVIVMPLADGGEGTVETLVHGMGGRFESVSVSGPLMEKIDAVYGIIEKDKTAIIEMSASAGLTLLPLEKRNPYLTTTYGIGEMIKDAIEKGCRNFIIGIGGSATNDGGVGMLQALGFEFLDENGREIDKGGKALENIYEIKTENAVKELRDCFFNVACDVDNVLCGESGASAVFGPQKGASKEMIEVLDNALLNFSNVTKNLFGEDFSKVSGTGAAGGLGFGFKAFLNSVLKPGIEIVLDEIDIDKNLKGVDVVITGEGRIDFQTMMGKAPIGVAKRAKKQGIKVFAIAGAIADDALGCNEKGIDAFFCVIDKAMSLEEAMEKETTKKNIIKTITQIFNVIKSCENYFGAEKK